MTAGGYGAQLGSAAVPFPGHATPNPTQLPTVNVHRACTVWHLDANRPSTGGEPLGLIRHHIGGEPLATCPGHLPGERRVVTIDPFTRRGRAIEAQTDDQSLERLLEAEQERIARLWRGAEHWPRIGRSGGPSGHLKGVEFASLLECESDHRADGNHEFVIGLKDDQVPACGSWRSDRGASRDHRSDGTGEEEAHLDAPQLRRRRLYSDDAQKREVCPAAESG